MKNTIIAAAAVMAIGTTGLVAGGDLAPVAPVMEVEVVAPWTGFYVGGAVSANQTYLDGEADWFGTSYVNKTAYGLQGDAGYTFYNNGTFLISAEGRIGGSFAGDDYVETSYWGVYAKPEVAFGAFGAYGLFGYGGVDMTDTENAELVDGRAVEYAVTVNENGFSYGFGGSYAINDTVSVFADYVVLPQFDLLFDRSIENDVISAGVNYRF